MKCLHCELEVSSNESFCCSGCKAAYSIIHGLGLNKYYNTRVLNPDVKLLRPDDEQADISRFIISDGDIKTLNLMVDGIHCASCVWLIESILLRQKNVIHARVNMSTRRLVLKWQYDDGSEFINLIASLGYRLLPFDPSLLESADIKYEKVLLKAIALAGFGAGNIMLFSAAVWSGADPVTSSFFHWISAIIAIPVIAYSGMPFFSSAKKALYAKHTNMDVPISLAVLLAGGMSLSQTITNGENIYFESCTMLLFFLLIGKYLDLKARRKARSAAEDLLLMAASSATVIEGESRRVIPASEIKKGMVLLVSTGEKIAADGIVIKGKSETDSSLITGETTPKDIAKGDKVFAGTINIASPVYVKVQETGDNTLLSEIIRLTENAERGEYVRLADKIAGYYTPIVHILALFTFMGWFMIANWQIALINAIAVLIITCPCAVSLAVPIVHVIASGRLMKKGILLKSGDALEKLTKIEKIVFDKTGTITLGKPVLKGEYKKEDLQLAASLAIHSKHPYSRAICNAYDGAIIDMKVKEKAGRGLTAFSCKSDVRKNEFFLGKKNGGTWLYKNGQPIIQFFFIDKLREDAKDVIAALGDYNPEILSGDAKSVVEKVAKEVGIVTCYAEQSPVDKCNYVGNVLMVGDGLNDAPSLSKASVSMSPSTAADITQTTADIIFQGEKLAPVLEVINVAKESKRKIKQNLCFAFLYNAIAVPLAISGNVTPLIAAIAMSSSSLIVILNSLSYNSPYNSPSSMR